MSEALISTLDELHSYIRDEMATLVYFSSPGCGVCQVLRPKIMEAMQQHYPKIRCLHVDLSITPDIGAAFQVLAAPTILLFLDGKEFIRKYRTISVDGLLQEIQRPYTMLME